MNLDLTTFQELFEWKKTQHQNLRTRRSCNQEYQQKIMNDVWKYRSIFQKQYDFQTNFLAPLKKQDVKELLGSEFQALGILRIHPFQIDGKTSKLSFGSHWWNLERERKISWRRWKKYKIENEWRKGWFKGVKNKIK